MAAPFKAYDVRGTYPQAIDETFARKIGAAVSRFLGGGRIGIGRDVRKSAPTVASALAEGIRSTGATAVDFGMITTPMIYHGVGSLGLDGGVMVTASHNPPQDIGFKICREEARPVGRDTGLQEIEADMGTGPGERNGDLEKVDLSEGYRTHVRSFLKHVPPMKIVVDAASGAVGPHFDRIFGDLPGVEWIRLCFEPDGNFPNHAPNPLEDENVRDLVAAMKESGADLGAAFDGDGDRCMFFEKGGARIRSDHLTALLARSELARHPGAAVVYDIRSSRVVHEEIVRCAGRPLRERVGHSFIKERMRANDAVLGGEVSGHYYFRDHYFADSGMIAFAKTLDLLGREKKTPGELLAPLRTTALSGEINYQVEDKEAVLRRFRSTFSDGRIDELDGVTIAYDDWWFNVRPSNTEPYLRLNVEAEAPDRLAAVLKKLEAVLGPQT